MKIPKIFKPRILNSFAMLGIAFLMIPFILGNVFVVQDFDDLLYSNFKAILILTVFLFLDLFLVTYIKSKVLFYILEILGVLLAMYILYNEA